ncbi:MAG: hypothetical protein JXC32_12350 [Anaerolineae bacterium]|nr:hypothetical protein [Anaerolineae bacterium]
MRRDLPLALLVFFLAVGVGLLSASPYFANAGLPADTDAELHVYRTAELGYSIRAGNPYPRWAPDFYHGYGYPIFNFYAPLTYHLGHWLTLGHPERAAAGARLLFIFSQVAGALGAYQLGKLFGGRGGGLLGALSFAAAPYILLINPHVRGDLPESFALAFVPWALWAWESVWRQGTSRTTWWAVLSTAVVFLSHNLTGLTILVLVAGLGAWRLVVGLGRTHEGTSAPGRAGAGAQKRRRAIPWHPNLGRAVMTGIIFVLITAFFWLPFLAERSHIQLDVAGDGHYDYRNHFVAPLRLLAQLEPIDRRATAADVPMTLGTVPVVAALGGLIAALRRHRFHDVGFYAVGAVVLFWMMTPSSQGLWEILPGLEYYQFPWRFLGPTAALLVPLVGSLALTCEPTQTVMPKPASGWARGVSRFVPAGATALLLFGALPGLYPLPWDAGFGFITPETIIKAELEGRWRGTTSTNDFVPASVEMIPGPQAEVLASYVHPPVDRVNRHTLPDGTKVDVIPSVPWVNAFAVATQRAFTLRLYLFDFPGWRAYVDGQPVSVELAYPEGFITVPVPAGDHEVIVRFGSTPARRWAWSLSAAGAISLVVAWIWDRRRRPTSWAGWRAPWAVRGPGGQSSASERLAVLQVAAVLTVIYVVKVTVFDPGGTFVLSTPFGQPPVDVVSQEASFGGEIALLGFDVTPEIVSAGQVLEAKLVWMATRPLTRTYQSFVHLVYPEGKIASQSDHLNPGGFPTDLWPLDRYVVDRHHIRIPEDAVPGTYLLSAGLYTLTDGVRVPVVSASCGHRPDSIVLCEAITVER